MLFNEIHIIRGFFRSGF